MTADAEGNDTSKVKYVTLSKIIVAPYDASKSLTADLIAPTIADPAGSLAEVFGNDSSAVGLITSDGAPQDGRDADDAIEFHQPGYLLAADPTLTLAFTVAEDNELTRLMTIGKPDATGVYHVSDIVNSDRWFAYQETHYKSGVVRRRLGVIQLTGNEPAQDTRGEVSGLSLTAQWQTDTTVDGGKSRYLQAYYDPSAATPTAKSASDKTTDKQA